MPERLWSLKVFTKRSDRWAEATHHSFRVSFLFTKPDTSNHSGLSVVLLVYPNYLFCLPVQQLLTKLSAILNGAKTTSAFPFSAVQDTSYISVRQFGHPRVRLSRQTP